MHSFIQNEAAYSGFYLIFPVRHVKHVHRLKGTKSIWDHLEEGILIIQIVLDVWVVFAQQLHASYNLKLWHFQVREHQIFRTDFTIRTTFEFGWVGGSKFIGCSNWNTGKIRTPCKSLFWCQNEIYSYKKLNMAFIMKHFGMIGGVVRGQWELFRDNLLEGWRVYGLICRDCSNWGVGGWVRINLNVVRIVKSILNIWRSLSDN